MRKQYTKEFKLGAISLVAKQNYTQLEAATARSPGINANMPGRWIKQQNSGAAQAFRGNGNLTIEGAEIRD